MKRKITLLAFVCSLLSFHLKLNAQQLSGTYAVPGAYTSIAAVINDINVFGISGAVTVNIAAGYTETVIPGGYTLNPIAGGSTLNTVTFRKNGVGVNPLIFANVGSNLPSSAIQDGVWRFIGCDNVTIDGIDINDPNTSNPATMEFGYGFFKASQIDGCQNNTIRNCTITLNRINNDFGSGPAVEGSCGIDMVNALAGSNTTNLTILAPSGSNSNNRFYSNVIQNCNIGIAIIGFQDVLPFNNVDRNNDIGGNSIATGNQILNFGGGGIISAAAGIRTLAQYGLNVSFNTVNNNNGAGVSHATTLRGILVGAATSASATINNNTLTISNGGTTSQVSIIENNSGTTALSNSITINNNLITGCTNSVTTSGPWYGIYNTGAPQFLNVNNNTFTNNTTNSQTGQVFSIFNAGGVVGVHNILNNNLSMTFVGPFAYSGTNYHIFNNTASTLSEIYINGNNFSNITHSTTAGTGAITYGIFAAAGNVLSLNNNLFNNLNLNHGGTIGLILNGSATQSVLTVNNNSIVTGFTRTGPSGTTLLYNSISANLGLSSQTITGNNFSNISSTVAGTGAFTGINSADGSALPLPRKLIFNNIINNVNFAGTGSSYGMNITNMGDGTSNQGSNIFNNVVSNFTTASSALNGIQLSGNVSPNFQAAVYQNTVSNLVSTLGSGGVYGMTIGTGTTGIRFFKNKINDVSALGTSGLAGGLLVSGINLNIFNNVIGAVSTPSSNLANALMGINVSSGQANITNNSVFLSGTSSGIGFGSNAIFVTTSASVTLRNNIFVNNAIATGAGISCAYRRSNNIINTYSNLSNNNLFFAGVPSASNVIYHDGITGQQTLANYKLAVLGSDASAVTENVPFASTVGSNASFLNINPAVPTLVQNNGIPVAGITDDFNGTTRSLVTPEIGAFEGNFLTVTTDQNPPVMTSFGFTNTPCNLSGRTLTVNLVDFTGVASTGTAVPKAYFRINAGTYSVVSGVLSSGTPTNGNWSFNMVYTAALNDVISFFVLAQDIVGTPNLFVSNPVGFTGSDVNTYTTAPTTPLSYTVTGVNLAGTYTVGATGTFTNLTAASLAYNTGCLTSSVTFVLSDPTYTNEVFPINFSNNIFASATNSLLIRPAASVTANITQTNTAGTSVIKFTNARFITLNGINASGSALNIINTNSTSASANIWLASAVSTATGNNFIDIRNLNVVGSATNINSNYGINASLDGFNPSTLAGPDNDNVVIQANTFVNCYHGIYATGSAGYSFGGLDNWAITSNTMGSTSPTLNTIGGHGIFLQGMLNVSVTANAMSNFSTTAGSISGIRLNSTVSGFTVRQNTLTGIFSNGTGSGVTSNSGMFFGNQCINGNVSFNRISGVINNNTGGWGVRGVAYALNTINSGNRFFNNFISDIATYDLGSINFATMGLEIGSSSGGIDIDNNSIWLFGSRPGSFTGSFSSPIAITSSGGYLRVRNNIFSNSYDNSFASDDKAYAFYSTAPISNYLVMNNNNFVANSTASNVLGFQTNLEYNTLAALQVATNQNANSVNMPVVFTATNDLHISLTSGVNNTFDNLGSPLASVTTDIDNQTRSLTTPDIGADEFTATLTCSGTPTAGVLNLAGTSVCPNGSVTIFANNYSGGAGTTYQWQVATNVSGPFSNVSSGSGTNTPVLTTGTFSTPGVYFVALRATCGTATALSSVASLTVLGLPTIVSNPSVICVSGSATLTASGASSYTWNTGSNSNVITVPTITNSTLFSVMGANPGCANVASNPLVVRVNPFSPVNVTVTPAASTVCVFAPASFTASGALAYVWNATTPGSTITLFQGSNTTHTVVGTNSAGCSGTATVSVVTNSLPVINVSPSVTTICANSTTSFSVSGAATYSWFNGSNASTIAVSPSISTVYSVTGADAFGCIGVGNAIVIANPLPSISIVPSNTSVCALTNVSLTANGAITYTWNNNSTNTTAVFAPSVTSTYSVNGTDILGCIGSQTISINALSLPAITIASSGASVCPGSSATLTASGAQNYTWQAGINTNTTLVTPTSQTTYTVSGTNTLGCSSNQSVSIGLFNLPNIVLNPANATICLGEVASFTASGASTYTWIPNNTTSNTFTTSPTTVTFYSVSATDANNCMNMVTFLVNVSKCTGLSNSALSTDGINVFPNPSKGIITATFEFEGNKEITVLNAMGQLILQINTENNQESFDLSAYAKGVYSIRINTKNGFANYRVITE